MKKGYSVEVTLTVLIVFAFLYTYITGTVFNAFEPPEFIVVISILIFWMIVLEILYRFRPGKHEPPSAFFLSLNNKDRVVFLISFALYLFIYSELLRIEYSSPPMTRLVFAGLGLILCSTPILFFGSKELKQKLFGKKK